MPLTYNCPQCGSDNVRRERISLPNGTAHEFLCNNCTLFESAFKERVDIDRLKARWSTPVSQPGDAADSTR